MSPATLKSMDVFQFNLNILRDRNPDLANIMEGQKFSGAYSIEPSKNGSPTLLFQDTTGKTISLHSRYNPEQEASQFIQNLELGDSSNFIIFGIGLGYHLLELIKNTPSHSNFLIIESKLEVFQRALQCEHFERLLRHQNIRWIVGENYNPEKFIPANWLDSFTLNGFTTVPLPLLTQLDPLYYKKLQSNIKETINETQVAHNTRRTLSRILYQNCFQNFKTTLNSPGILPLKNIYKNEPVMIVAAGPSLDKNIQLIHGSSKACRIIAVSTALKPLQDAGIEPDFTVAIDPKPVSCAAFENLPTASKANLIFDPCIPKFIPGYFTGNRFAVEAQPYIWKFLSRGLDSKGELGNSSSVAHTALNLALHMGCNPIILVGQDLSFSKDRSHCSGAFHGEFHQQNIGTNQTTTRLKQRQRGGTIQASETSQDIFGNSLTTNKALDTFRFPFEKLKTQGTRLINATEGGINISNMENSTLKETLAELPQVLITNKIISKIPHQPDQSKKRIPQVQTIAIQSQIIKFENLLNAIRSWKDPYPKTDSENDRKLTFTPPEIAIQVSAAAKILENLIEDEDSIQLLQEYLYSEFLDWNQKTYQIKLLKNEDQKFQKKLERDKLLFSEIEKAIKWFNEEFKSLLH